MKRFTPVYACGRFEPIVRKGHFELMWITITLTSLDICAHTMFEILTIQIIVLNEKRNWFAMKF